MAEAVKTHIHDFHECKCISKGHPSRHTADTELLITDSIVTRRIQLLIAQGQEDLAVAVRSVDAKVDGLSEQNQTIVDSGIRIQETLNSVMALISDKHEQERRILLGSSVPTTRIVIRILLLTSLSGFQMRYWHKIRKSQISQKNSGLPVYHPCPGTPPAYKALTHNSYFNIHPSIPIWRRLCCCLPFLQYRKTSSGTSSACQWT